MNYKNHIKNTREDNIDKWISMKREKIELSNPALFKAKDIGFLKEVVSYLENNGLNLQLKGSVNYNSKRNILRNYGDIDLLVLPDFKNSKYLELTAKLARASQDIKKIKDWEIENLSEKGGAYVNISINYRFKIKSPKTKTIIDLSFKF